jgi:importin subunit beta-1
VSRNYSGAALPHIVPILFEQLAKQEEDVDEDEWTPTKAAGVCILLLAQCCGDAIVDHTLPFISQHFLSGDWHYREAAIMAFGSVLEGPSVEKLTSLADQAILPLVGAVSDANLEVRDTAAWAIGRVCDSCQECVVKEGNLKSMLQALLAALRDHPRVASNACWVSPLVSSSCLCRD